jgi:hypothetical protein
MQTKLPIMSQNKHPLSRSDCYLAFIGSPTSLSQFQSWLHIEGIQRETNYISHIETDRLYRTNTSGAYSSPMAHAFIGGNLTPCKEQLSDFYFHDISVSYSVGSPQDKYLLLIMSEQNCSPVFYTALNEIAAYAVNTYNLDLAYTRVNNNIDGDIEYFATGKIYIHIDRDFYPSLRESKKHLRIQKALNKPELDRWTKLI